MCLAGWPTKINPALDTVCQGLSDPIYYTGLLDLFSKVGMYGAQPISL